MKSQSSLPWIREKLSSSVGKITWEGVKPGDKGYVLFQADDHIDNKSSDTELLRKHHKTAVSRGAPIVKVGDTFCAMQGKWDKRKDEDQLREELRGNNYLDKLVSFAAKHYMEFAGQIAFLTNGNHEVSILERHQTDLLARLSDRLKAGNNGIGPEVLTYGSFLRLTWRTKTGSSVSRVGLLHHGYGAGGEVTRGLIDNSRTARQYSADFYVSGHIHRRNEDENVLVYLSSKDNIVEKDQHFIRCSTYKREHDSMDSWHTQKGRGARPIGGYWLHWEIFRDRRKTAAEGGGLGVELLPIKTSSIRG